MHASFPIHSLFMSTPMQVHEKLRAAVGPATKQDLDDRGNWPYEIIQGGLTWLVIATTPELAQAVSETASHSSNWRVEHKRAQQRILRYIAGHMDDKLVYTRQQSILRGSKCVQITDSSFGDCERTGRSRGGRLSFVYGNLTAWQSKRQRHVATSPHSETIACDEGVRQHQ